MSIQHYILPDTVFVKLNKVKLCKVAAYLQLPSLASKSKPEIITMLKGWLDLPQSQLTVKNTRWCFGSIIQHPYIIDSLYTYAHAYTRDTLTGPDKEVTFSRKERFEWLENCDWKVILECCFSMMTLSQQFALEAFIDLVVLWCPAYELTRSLLQLCVPLFPNERLDFVLQHKPKKIEDTCLHSELVEQYIRPSVLAEIRHDARGFANILNDASAFEEQLYMMDYIYYICSMLYPIRYLKLASRVILRPDLRFNGFMNPMKYPNAISAAQLKETEEVLGRRLDLTYIKETLVPDYRPSEDDKICIDKGLEYFFYLTPATRKKLAEKAMEPDFDIYKPEFQVEVTKIFFSEIIPTCRANMFRVLKIDDQWQTGLDMSVGNSDEFYDKMYTAFENAVEYPGHSGYATLMAYFDKCNNYAEINLIRENYNFIDKTPEPNPNGEPNICSICICPVPETSGIRLACSHEYCSPCLLEWIYNHNKRTCPVCRAVFTWCD